MSFNKMKSKNSIFVFLIALALSLGCKEDSPAPLITNASSFEFVWNKIDQTYPFFENSNVDWDQVKVTYGSQVTESMPMTEFRDLLLEMTLLLEDNHTGMEIESQVFTHPLKPVEVDSRPVNVEAYLENITVNSNHVVVGDIKDKNVRYLAVKTLSQFAGPNHYDAFPEVFADLARYDGIIIDLRVLQNPDDRPIEEFIRYYLSENRVFRRYRIRNSGGRNSFSSWTDDRISGQGWEIDKPIVILTSRHIANKAENFTLMLRSHPQAMLLGDTTAGDLSGPVMFRIPHGWNLLTSSLQVVDMDGRLVEGTGIIPDETVQYTQADRTNGIDPILQAAIDKFE